MAEQRFRIQGGGIGGEWVCAGCGAPMVEAADGQGGVTMTHADRCPEVSKMAGGQQ